jgi:nuclease S1
MCLSMRFRKLRFVSILLLFLVLLFAPSSLRAWGCKGHQTVALIAEKYLTPDAREFVEKLLRENPVDPQSGLYCGGADFGPLATASNWPDDIRHQRPDTAPWHYINIPRGPARGPVQAFCGDRGCITKAIVEQLAILKDGTVQPAKRGGVAVCDSFCR